MLSKFKWIVRITFVVALLGSSVVYGNTGVFFAGSDTAIFLRWYPSGDKEQSFNVYKKQEGSFVRLNSKPIRPLHHRRDILELLGAEWPTIRDQFKIRYPEEIHLALNKNPLADIIAGTVDPRIAVLRGVGYVDTNVNKGKKYTYKVTVMDNTGERIIATDIKVEARTVLPKAPTMLEALPDNESVHLRWKTPDGPHAGFDILRGMSKNGRYTKINEKRILISAAVKPDGSLPTYFTDRSVKVGVTYWYRVVALDVFGCLGKQSSPVSATPYDSIPPSSPVIYSIDPWKQVIQWRSPTDRDLVGFLVYRSKRFDSLGTLLTLSPLSDSTTKFFDKKASPNTLYWYTVVAIDENGNEAKSIPKLAKFRFR